MASGVSPWLMRTPLKSPDLTRSWRVVSTARLSNGAPSPGDAPRGERVFDLLQPLDGVAAELGRRSRVDRVGDGHGVGRQVDHRLAVDDLGEGAGVAAVLVDDALLRHDDRRRRRRPADLQANAAGAELVDDREVLPRRPVDRDRGEREQRPGTDGHGYFRLGFGLGAEVEGVGVDLASNSRPPPLPP